MRKTMCSLVGQKFGKRTIISEAGKSASREQLYLCRCSCGREDVIGSNPLRKGKANQCKACSAAATRNRTSHGISKTPIYNSWKAMMHRCYMPNTNNYHNYGGRGIAVCQEWHDPKTFYEWAIKNGWAPGLSIDREDVDAGYSPENCRWATAAEQRENVQLLTQSNKSGYRGVSMKSGRDRWLARIAVQGQIVHLGHHETPEAAALAYDNYIINAGIKRPLNFNVLRSQKRGVTQQ